MIACWRFSIDTGGTFTDCVGVSPDGKVSRIKVLSSSRIRLAIKSMDSEGRVAVERPAGFELSALQGYRVSRGGESANILSIDAVANELVLDHALAGSAQGFLEVQSDDEAPIFAVRLLLGCRCDEELAEFEMRLGTTKATNALLEGKADRVALFVTRGFRDLLTIGDQRRPDLFAQDIRRPAPLYERVVEVDERMESSGEVSRLLDLGSLDTAIDAALQRGIRTAAVALLNSYRNGEHERVLKEYLERKGFAYVVASSDLAAQIKYVPRAGTTVIDAALGPLMSRYLDGVWNCMQRNRLWVMTSAGGLISRQRFRPFESLLSGPAGGVSGAQYIGKQTGHPKVIAFDMGGTSTDVSRVEEQFEYQNSHAVGDTRVMATALKIESVAAGGGSICGWDGVQLTVGPESAGANPGPACYGLGGPLCITDVDLLLGRISSTTFAIPLIPQAAQKRVQELLAVMSDSPDTTTELVLEALAEIANERMAAAIKAISVREGYTPSRYALVAFGGAGGMHCCSVANKLGMSTILYPHDAGLMCARGLDIARVESFAERQVLQTLDEVAADLDDAFCELGREACTRLEADGIATQSIAVRTRLVEARLQGQESAITLDYREVAALAKDFEQAYRQRFNYYPEGKPVEVVLLRVVAATVEAAVEREIFSEGESIESSANHQPCFFAGRWHRAALLNRVNLASGSVINGPAIVGDGYSTLFVEPGWRGVVGTKLSLRLQRVQAASEATSVGNTSLSESALALHRLSCLVEEMGLQLQRTSISTNVKERLDFSCALLDAEGRLLINAPHIPVHLGALGHCTRLVLKALPLEPGDIVITNHPAYGGSHLPDVTLIAPLHDSNGVRHGFIANRAHHAEIGGIRPGSMPPDARCLAEEGVVIPPTYLFRKGIAQFENVEQLLTAAEFPTRSLADNLADIRAQVASLLRGQQDFARFIDAFSSDAFRIHTASLFQRAAEAVRNKLRVIGQAEFTATEYLDDGTPICVRLSVIDELLKIDFTGTGGVHPGNLNANPGIVRSALTYVLRVWVGEDLPLNEGFLEPVEIVLPTCFLNPDFPLDAHHAPAVVGGNVETSQRLVDTLFKALGIAACSQGTMNNLVFGNSRFSYYETNCGGAGAGEGYNGASTVHTHMTNTAITDPEILEWRYPVRLLRFERRMGSGGKGKFAGGDGVIREMEFREPLSLSLLTQHRVEAPYGLHGGESGACGRQTLIRADGKAEVLLSIAKVEVCPGDRLVMETPGGGAWGK